MTDDRNLPPWVRTLLEAEEYHIFDSEEGQAIKRVLDSGLKDSLSWEWTNGQVERCRIRQAFQGPFRIPHLNKGDLLEGFDRQGRPILTRLQSRMEHSLTLSSSGGGKTTRSRFLALQIVPQVKGVWLFDLRKQEFACLRPLLQRVGVDLIVLKIEDMRFNPLQVPAHVDPSTWASCMADLLVQVLHLPPRANKLLHVTIFDLYESFGVLGSAPKQEYPTLFDVRRHVAGNAQANPQARQAITDSLDPLLLSLRDALSYRYGWPTSELASRRIVFSFGSKGDVERDLMLNALILSEFMSRVAQGVSNPTMDLYLVVDEAQRLISSTTGSLAFPDLLGLIRGTGIGVDLSVQSASAVHPSILSNTASKFLGRCGSVADYDVGAAMGLTKEQRRWLSLHATPGLFAGQLGSGKWRHPFLVRIPPLNLSSAGAGSQAGGLGNLLQLPCIPA